MITIEAPCCDQLLVIETPLPEALSCDECAVTWHVVDPQQAMDRVAALVA